MSLSALVHYADSDIDSDEDTGGDDSTSLDTDSGNSKVEKQETKVEENKVDAEKPTEDNISDENDDDIDDKIVDNDISIDDSKTDDKDKDNEESDVEDMEVDEPSTVGKPAKPVKRYSCDSALAFAKKIQNLQGEDDIELPPEPDGVCSPALQSKIKMLYEKKIRGGENLIYAIQSRKDFRNPSIYEKFLLLLGIEERGTNFPKSDFDPDFWRKQPSYADLSRVQREDMAKREKEKKTKVEFVTGTAKKPNSRPGSSEPAKRTKWDKPAPGVDASRVVPIITSQNNASLSASSVTKSIPAVGDLKSRPSKHK